MNHVEKVPDDIFGACPLDLEGLEKTSETIAVMQMFQALYDDAMLLLPECRIELYLDKTDAIVCLETQNGKLFSRKIGGTTRDQDEENIANEIGCETVIKLVYIWGNGGIDMPSYHFRRLLCDRNITNLNASILLIGKNKLVIKTLGETMPPSYTQKQ